MRPDRDRGGTERRGEARPPYTLTQLQYMSFDEQRDDAQLDIVGELSHQDAIVAAIRSRLDVGPYEPFTAFVIPEPANRYDRNALLVVLLHGDGQAAAVVGYLSRENTIAYRPVMARVAPRVIGTTARLQGGQIRPGEPALFGVVLHLGTPSELMAELWMSTFGPPPVHRWTGKTVCFAGPSHRVALGVQLHRQGQEYLARKAGCKPWPRITRKVDLCVAGAVADEADKLAKAEGYGIEIVREDAFWAGVGLVMDRWQGTAPR